MKPPQLTQCIKNPVCSLPGDKRHSNVETQNRSKHAQLTSARDFDDARATGAWQRAHAKYPTGAASKKRA